MDPQRVYSLGELQADFDFLKETLLTRNPLVNADRKELSTLLAVQREKLRAGMGDLELFRVLSPVVAAARCGHTGIRLSAAANAFLRSQARALPVRVRFIRERLFLLDPLNVQGIPVGAEITGINDRSTREIHDLLLKGIGADGENVTRKYAVLNATFNEGYQLLVETPDRFTIRFVDPGEGTEQSVTTAGTTRVALDAQGRVSSPPYSSTFDAPDIATLTVRTFTQSPEQFKAFLEQFFTAAKDHHVSTLILDLRENWGGDPWTSSALYTYLIREPSPYFEEGTLYYGALTRPLPPAATAFQGRLLVLAGGASFSSTGHLCSLLRFHGLATFIGEETGGSFSCTDAGRDFTLPASGIVLHSSTHEFRTAVSGFSRGRGILPDFEVIPAIDDLVNGRDVQKAFALALARAGTTE
jgi:C-terminal processing protease CtpA/Prc